MSIGAPSVGMSRFVFVLKNAISKSFTDVKGPTVWSSKKIYIISGTAV
jgi:hypothetical protein